MCTLCNLTQGRVYMYVLKLFSHMHSTRNPYAQYTDIYKVAMDEIQAADREICCRLTGQQHPPCSPRGDGVGKVGQEGRHLHHTSRDRSVHWSTEIAKHGTQVLVT